VNREEAKRVEAILEQFPARKISMKRLDNASRSIRRSTPEEQSSTALQFAKDLMRFRRDRRELSAGRSVDGTNQLGAFGARSRAISREQEPVRILASR